MMKLSKFLKDESWKKELAEEFEKPYFMELEKFLGSEFEKKNIFPEKENVFNAFNLTSIDKVKVVIIGQDPYHGMGQAHGLCFSVLPPTKNPPSLVNIFKELNSDLGLPIPSSGDLSLWAKEGVLLLNTVMTVEEGKANSHQKKGWEIFTDKVIEVLNRKKENLVFMAWGAPAQKKIQLVDTNRHYIISSVHPSPLSSYRGFFGSKPFSKCNKYLKDIKINEINWDLTK